MQKNKSIRKAGESLYGYVNRINGFPGERSDAESESQGSFNCILKAIEHSAESFANMEYEAHEAAHAD